MSDDLVKRLRSMHWCVTTETNGVGVSDRNVALEAADHIEQLTAERDSLLAGHRTLNIDGARLEDRAKAAEAERDRLRVALEQFLIEYDEVDLANAEPSSLTEAVLEARAALKGETP